MLNSAGGRHVPEPDGAAHQHDALQTRGQVGIERERGGDIGQWPGRDDDSDPLRARAVSMIRSTPCRGSRATLGTPNAGPSSPDSPWISGDAIRLRASGRSTAGRRPERRGCRPRCRRDAR